MSRNKQTGTSCFTCGHPVPVLDGRSWRKKTCSLECRNAMRRLRYTRKPPPPLAPLEVRLWSKVARVPSGCWEWQGFRQPTGYGQIGMGRQRLGVASTHRVAWELHNQAAVPPGLVVRHKCDNPPCCNPHHLVVGTHADNHGDMVSRGRMARGSMLPHTKLTDPQVQEIRLRYDPKGGGTGRGGTRSNAARLAEEFGVSKAYIMQLVHGWYRRDVA